MGAWAGAARRRPRPSTSGWRRPAGDRRPRRTLAIGEIEIHVGGDEIDRAVMAAGRAHAEVEEDVGVDEHRAAGRDVVVVLEVDASHCLSRPCRC